MKITKKLSAQKDTSYRVQFSDVALYDFMVEIGLTSNKSLTLPQLSVPDEFFRYFARGVFDGDGSIYGFFDKRWKSSFMFYSVFYSASPKFIEYLQESMRLLMGINGSISKSCRVQRLQYAKQESKELYKFMYGIDGSLALSRKRKKFNDFILKDIGDNIV